MLKRKRRELENLSGKKSKPI
ncbi:hypothetical protein C5167_051093 [Papaver somniferum]|uniref:Uncharacterized protein n=1 Tax=Papaver somniferum TaxID=3469 RepID=A0A4Y7KQH5_PAPSO|nr:hypothetical protein C5167_051093 [Papaver somniferum]